MINLSRSLLGLYLLIYGEARSAEAVRARRELDDASSASVSASEPAATSCNKFGP